MVVVTGAWLNGKSPAHSFFQMYFGGLEAMGQTYDPFVKGLARAQLEFMGLMSRRAQAYMEIPSRLGHCRTPQDVANEQLRFWQVAFEEYTESFGRVTEAMSSFATPPFGIAPADETDDAHDYLRFPETKDRQRSGRTRERRAA